jgi:hypothetical protein
MAERFNLTAQLNLQAPNTQKVATQIRRDLQGINVPVDIQTNAKALAATQGQLQNIDKGAKQASKSMNFFNKNLAEAARRFSVITVATGSFISLARAVKNSTGAAIEFQREIVRISQVTGKSVDNLKGLQAEVTRLSTGLGVANASLLETSRVLAQAGLSASKTKQALQVLANTTLAPSFDNIVDTTEGAIAILNQFGREAKRVGNDIKFLEQSLDAVNQVSKNFAVESADLISTVRRTGGVFQAAGGNINELIALFTSVRQTTRESAETIATGFRTIFTRLQRKDTIDALNELGISLQDAEGKFVGPLKAIEKLAIGLAGLDPKDVRFNEIVEQLGGFRQIGKVIPLIKQYSVAQQALAVANNSAGSTAKDAQTAQQALATQFDKTREQFDALIRKFAASDTFQSLAKDALNIANAFLKFAESLEKILPQLTAIAGIKLGKALAPGLLGLFGPGGRKNSGGKILGFNSGGFVPGSGNRDTVPAMLTPGEFVIRKGSVQQLGAENLARMNEGRKKFAGGGTVKRGVEDLTQSKAVTFNTDVEPSKKKGDVFQGKKRFTTGDTLNFKRANDIAVDVNDYPNRRSAGFKEYRDAVRNNDSQARGIAFEKVVTEVNSGIKLATQQSGFSDKDSPSSRLDSVYKGIPREIKSRQKVISDNELAKKVVGASINPISDIDKVIQGKLTQRALRGPDEKPDNVNLGQAGLIYDNTDLTKINKQIEQSDPQLGGATKSSSSQKSQRLRATKKAFGGLIQKFAAGGIVEQGAAGAAILDPVGASSSTVKVSNEDVKNSFGEFKKLAKGKDPVSKFYKARSFELAKSGLNQETSDKFKNILEDGLVAGINNSAAALSRDLGTPSATISGGETANFVRSINTSIFGRLYETVIESISNSGKFSGSDPNRPFDAEGGLPSGLQDNFSGLPAKFIDLKSSEAAAGDANLKGKIVDQIKRELIQDGILNTDYPGKASAEKKRAAQDATTQRARDKKAAQSQGFEATVGRRRGFNSGGGISGKDTVPALLTPGEFVFNKSAAQSIGYGNLSKMNTQGVKGYNKGGVVGFKKYANGTGPTGVPSGGGGGIASLDLSGIQAAIATLEATANDYSQSLSSNSAALDRAKAANEDTSALVAEKAQAETTLAAVYNKLGELYDSEEFAKLEIAEAKLTETIKKQDKQLEELIKAEEAAELAARKGAERQPKKERIGPSGGQAKGAAVSIGKSAQAGLEGIAGGAGVKLAGIQRLYLSKLEEGATRQEGLNAVAAEVYAFLEENKQGVAELTAANKELTEKYNEVGARSEEQAADMRGLNQQTKFLSEASGQVDDILRQYKANIAEGQGKTDALNNSIRSVTAEQGKSLADFKTLRKSVLQRVVEEKKIAQEDKKLASAIKDEIQELEKSKPNKDLNCECPDGGSGGSGGGGENKLSAGLSKAAGALNGLTNAAIGYTLIQGTLTQSSEALSEEEKRVANAGNNAAAAFIGIAAQIGSLALEVGSNIVASIANATAKTAEATASAKTTVSITSLGFAADKTTASFFGLEVAAGALGAVVGVLASGLAVTFIAVANETKKTAEALERFDIAIEKSAKVADEELEKLGQKGGQPASEEKFVQARVKAVQQEADKTRRANEGARRSTAAAVGGITGTLLAVAGTVAAFGLGLQAIPVVGNIVGGVLIGLAAAAAGVAVALTFFAGETEAEAKAYADASRLAASITETYARAQFRAAKATNDLANVLQEAKDQGLDFAKRRMNVTN